MPATYLLTTNNLGDVDDIEKARDNLGISRDIVDPNNVDIKGGSVSVDYFRLTQIEPFDTGYILTADSDGVAKWSALELSDLNTNISSFINNVPYASQEWTCNNFMRNEDNLSGITDRVVALSNLGINFTFGDVDDNLNGYLQMTNIVMSNLQVNESAQINEVIINDKITYNTDFVSSNNMVYIDPNTKEIRSIELGNDIEDIDIDIDARKRPPSMALLNTVYQNISETMNTMEITLGNLIIDNYYLQITRNLSDLPDAEIARSNLGFQGVTINDDGIETGRLRLNNEFILDQTTHESGQFLRCDASGKGTWESLPDATATEKGTVRLTNDYEFDTTFDDTVVASLKTIKSFNDGFADSTTELVESRLKTTNLLSEYKDLNINDRALLLSNLHVTHNAIFDSPNNLAYFVDDVGFLRADNFLYEIGGYSNGIEQTRSNLNLVKVAWTGSYYDLSDVPSINDDMYIKVDNNLSEFESEANRTQARDNLGLLDMATMSRSNVDINGGVITDLTSIKTNELILYDVDIPIDSMNNNTCFLKAGDTSGTATWGALPDATANQKGILTLQSSFDDHDDSSAYTSSCVHDQIISITTEINSIVVDTEIIDSNISTNSSSIQTLSIALSTSLYHPSTGVNNALSTLSNDINLLEVLVDGNRHDYDLNNVDIYNTLSNIESELTIVVENQVNTLNTSISTTTSTLNTSISTTTSTLNTSISTTTSTLNTRIDYEVSNINEDILYMTSNVSTLDGSLSLLKTQFQNLHTMVDSSGGVDSQSYRINVIERSLWGYDNEPLGITYNLSNLTEDFSNYVLSTNSAIDTTNLSITENRDRIIKLEIQQSNTVDDILEIKTDINDTKSNLLSTSIDLLTHKTDYGYLKLNVDSNNDKITELQNSLWGITDENTSGVKGTLSNLKSEFDSHEEFTIANVVSLTSNLGVTNSTLSQATTSISQMTNSLDQHIIHFNYLHSNVDSNISKITAIEHSLWRLSDTEPTGIRGDLTQYMTSFDSHITEEYNVLNAYSHSNINAFSERLASLEGGSGFEQETIASNVFTILPNKIELLSVALSSQIENEQNNHDMHSALNTQLSDSLTTFSNDSSGYIHSLSNSLTANISLVDNVSTLANQNYTDILSTANTLYTLSNYFNHFKTLEWDRDFKLTTLPSIDTNISTLESTATLLSTNISSTLDISLSTQSNLNTTTSLAESLSISQEFLSINLSTLEVSLSTSDNDTVNSINSINSSVTASLDRITLVEGQIGSTGNLNFVSTQVFNTLSTNFSILNTHVYELDNSISDTSIQLSNLDLSVTENYDRITSYYSIPLQDSDMRIDIENDKIKFKKKDSNGNYQTLHIFR
jgi:hypothetical protein